MQGVSGQVSAAGDYLGNAFSGVDSKQRFTLPADFRKRIKEVTGESTLIVQYEEGSQCLKGFGRDHLDEIKAEISESARVARERGEAFDRHQRALAQMADVETANFDDGGRFSLSDDIKGLLGITDSLFFVGAIWNFEIWSPTRFLESDTGSTLSKARCRAGLDQWLANPKNPNRTA